LNNSEKEVSNLKQQIEGLLNKTELLNEKEKELAKINNDFKASEKEIEELNTKLKDLENANSRYEELINDNKRLNEEILNKFNSNEEELRKLRNINAKQTEEIEKVDYYKDKIAVIEKEKGIVINNLNKRLDELEFKNKSYNEDKSIKEDKIVEYKKEIENLVADNKKLQEADKYKNEIIGDQSYKLAQLENIKTKYSDLDVKFNNTVETFKDQIAQLNQKMNQRKSM
jgi:chromosome segregation ATPase